MFLGGAASRHHFLKAWKLQKPKVFFPYEKFDQLNKRQNADLSACDSFYIKLRSLKQKMTTLTY